MSRNTKLLTLVIAAALTVAAVPGVSSAGTDDELRPTSHFATSEVLAGIKASFLDFIEGGKAEQGWGIQAFGETTVLEGLLDVELVVSVFVLPSEIELPIDIVLKKPFHLGERVQPYIGVGTTLALVFEDSADVANGEDGEEMSEHGGSGRDVAAGVLAVAGAYWWISDHFGLDLELNYTIATRGELIHELIVSSGPTFRF